MKGMFQTWIIFHFVIKNPILKTQCAYQYLKRNGNLPGIHSLSDHIWIILLFITHNPIRSHHCWKKNVNLSWAFISRKAMLNSKFQNYPYSQIRPHSQGFEEKNKLGGLKKREKKKRVLEHNSIGLQTNTESDFLIKKNGTRGKCEPSRAFNVTKPPFV